MGTREELEAELALRKEINEQRKKDLLLAGMEEEAADRLVEKTDRRVHGLQRAHDILVQSEGLSRRQGRHTTNKLRQEEIELEIQLEELEVLSRIEGADQKAIDAKRIQLTLEKEKLSAQGRAVGKAQEMAAAVTGVSSKWREGLFGAIMEGGIEESLSKIGAGLKEQFTLANMLGSSMMKVQEATMAMVWQADSLFASTNQLTNGTGEYNEMIMDVHDSNAQFNVDLETASKAVSTLYQDMSQFTEMTEQSQAALVEATAQLEGLGIDASATAANMEVLNKSLGMSAEEAIAVQKDFAAMASDLGVNAAQISKDFSDNANTFTAYGKEAVRVFKDTAAASKATGIEMGKLLGITGQFDTFEGAANAAGKLNAILGGGMLNSMDLLNASEEERVRMLIQSVEASGKSWDSMNKFERMAVANAAGISDMTEANKLFGTSLAEYDKAQEKVEDNSAAQAELEERAKAATSAQDKFKRIMEQFAVAVIPVLSVITFFADALVTLNDWTGGLLIPTLIGLLGVMALINWATEGSITTMAKEFVMRLFGITIQEADKESKEKLEKATGDLADESGKSAPKMAALTASIASMAAAAAPLLPAITAVAFAIGGLGLAIAAPFIALAVLVWSLKELIIAFMEMPDAIMPAIAGFLALGAASLIALPMMAAGLAAFVFILFPVAWQMPFVAAGLITLAGAAAVFGAAAYLLGAGFKALSAGLTDFPIGTMLLLTPALILFSLGLLMAAPFMLLGGILFGVGALIAGAGLNTLASGVEAFTAKGMVKALYDLIPSLIGFSLGLFFAAVPMLAGGILFGVGALIAGMGLNTLADGIERFTERGMIRAMTKIIWPLIAFSFGLMAAAVPLAAASIYFLVGAVLAGIGLMVLAKGIAGFNDQGMIETMLYLGPALILFGIMAFIASVPLANAAIGIIFAGVLMGIGLMVLAKGIAGFNEEGMIITMALLAPALILFAIGMFAASVPLMAAAYPILIAGALLGIGLGVLGLGISMFNEKGMLATMAILGPVLVLFAISMFLASIPLLAASIPILIAGVLLGLGLGVLALGIGMYDASIIANMALLGPVLVLFAFSMFFASIPLLAAAIPIFIAGTLLGLGLGILGLGLMAFGKVDPAFLAMIGPALVMFAFSLYFAAPWLMAAAGLIAPAALLLGVALAILALGLAPWMKMNIAQVALIGPTLAILGVGLLLASAPLLLAAPFFLIAALLIAPAMAILAKPLMAFAQAIAVIGPFAGVLPALAWGLVALGLALPIFGFGLFMLGVFASLPFFDKGLETLTTALYTFADAMSTISTEKAVALGQVFEGLSKLTDMDNIGDLLFEVAMGIFWMARAIETLPEEKTIALAMLAPAMADLIDSAVQLTPEAVENVNKLVVAAGEYASAQAEMSLSADMDPFVAAIREALSPSGGGGGGGGQDIILVLNGREFARAVDVAIEKNHSLGID